MSSEGHLFRLDGKTVAVIGAGSGIGAAAARACARQGAHVACLDLDAAAAQRIAGEVASRDRSASCAQLDITDRRAIEQVLFELDEELDGLEGVVCTPGVNVRKPILDYEAEELDRVLDLNLRGTFHVLQVAGRAMRSRGRGSIVALSSIRSLVVEPGQGVYAATKAGIVALVRTLAAELGSSGVRVNALAPGIVDTPLTRPIKENADWYRAYAGKTALGRWADADEMGGPVAFLLSDAASYVTGTVLFADGGWTAIDGRFEPPGMADR